MARKKSERANLGEQINNRGMEADRAERTSGVHGDGTAGDEGIDDMTARTQRDDMSATPMHGDELSENADQSRSMSERGSQAEKSQRGDRTTKRTNDERFDKADDFSGQGSQKEGSDKAAEGTGYTQEGSNTDESSSGNPLT